MKKSILFMSAVAMLAAASCNKPELENIDKAPEVGTNEFVAYAESPTKTQLNDLVTEWVANDKIDIKGVAYITDNGGARAIFSKCSEEDENPVAPYYAAYPYSCVNYYDDSNCYAINVLNEFSLKANHIGDYVPAVAYSESEASLYFQNVASLFKFQVPTIDEPITEIRISATEVLAGEVVIDQKGEVPTWITESGFDTYTELILTTDDAFDPTATYYVPVLPGKKTNLTVKLNGTVVATGISMEFKRNVIHNVETLPSTEVRTVYLKPGVWAADNAWFSAHFFGAADVDTKMIDSDNDGIYEVAVPNGATGVIFCRMNPTHTEFSWDEGHVWNQSADLTVPAADAAELYYVVTDWSAGDWKTYEDATAEPEAPEVEAFEAWTGYVYLQTNAKWNEANARFAAYFFEGANNQWVSLELAENATNVYGCKVPDGYSNVIFCRMNPDASANNWDNKWGQTSDLMLADGNLYVLATDSWDSGSWMTVEAVEPPVAPEPEEPEVVVPGQNTEWALVGAFSGWADKTLVTTETPDVLVLKNVAIKAAEGFLVRKPATEWADKYGASSVNYLKSNYYITTSHNGADMCLEADGTYDIYFNTSTHNLYVMAAGADYTTATLQTASGKEPVQEEPEVTEKVVYLKPNAYWNQSNARFAAYFFGGSSGEKWVSMTAVGDGTYSVHLPEGYDYGCNIIFCRMNPSTTANNWNNKWNQTSDLKTPTDGNNLYTVKESTWDKGGGTWSVK